jgi:rod shape-determining protein MreD
VKRLNLRLVLVFLSGWLVQMIFVPYLRIYQAQPNIILIIVVSYAFLRGPSSGAVAGFIGGLLEDLLSLRPLGLSTIGQTIIGYLAGIFAQTIFGGIVFLPAITIAVASFSYQLVYLSIAFVFGHADLSLNLIKVALLPSAVYTGLVGSVLFPWLRQLFSSQAEVTVFD